MKYVLTALLLSALAIFAACGGDDDDGADVPASVCPENPSPATDETLIIDVPESGDEVTSPVHISGQISAFVQHYYVTIIDATGNHVVDDYPGTSDQPDVLVPFEIDVPFFVTEAVDACLIVSRQTENPERDEQKLQVPVRLLPESTPEAAQ